MPSPFASAVAISVPFDNSTNGFTADEVQSAIEEAKNTAEGTTARYAVVCGYQGTATNRFLEFFNSISSDITPFVLAEDADLKSFSAAVKIATTATFEIYKNGVAVDTLVLTAEKKNIKSGLSIAFLAEDELSVKLISGNGRDIVLSTFFQLSI